MLYLVSGMRWAFYGRGALEEALSFVTIGGLIVLGSATLGLLFKASTERRVVSRYCCESGAALDAHLVQPR